jgi:hypothetical protein
MIIPEVTIGVIHSSMSVPRFKARMTRIPGFEASAKALPGRGERRARRESKRQRTGVGMRRIEGKVRRERRAK